MNAKALVLSAFLIALAPFSCAGAPPQPPGLVKIKTPRLDQLFASEDRALLASRKIVLAPIEVRFDRDSLDYGSVSGLSLRAKPDLRRIAREMSESVRTSLAAALQASGYQMVSAPGPGILVVRASVQDIVINAPQVDSPAVIGAYTREVGKATMRLEVEDGNGSARAWSLDRRIAGDTGRPIRASDVSNRFWFEAMFRNWARDVATELAALS